MTRRMMRELNTKFESMMEILAIRQGKKQTIKTLINEEALLFAKYLRGEKTDWTPRISHLKGSGVRARTKSQLKVNFN